MNVDFTYSKFIGWMTYAAIQATLIFYVSFYVMDQSLSSGYFTEDENAAGKPGDFVMNGYISFGVVVVTVTSKILYDSNTHNVLSCFFALLSVGSFFFTGWIWSFMTFSEAYGDWTVSLEFVQSFFILFFFACGGIPVDMLLHHWQKSHSKDSDSASDSQLIVRRDSVFK